MLSERSQTHILVWLHLHETPGKTSDECKSMGASDGQITCEGKRV